MRLQEEHCVVLLSNGFQSEYEVGFANGLARCGLKPLLVCSDKLQRDRLDPEVTPINLRGSQDAERSSFAKAANILRYWWTTIALLRKQKARAVHVTGLFTLRSTLVSFLEAVVLRIVARHFVLTVHNLLPHDSHGPVNRIAYWMIYRLPNRLVVHTAGMRDGLQREFGIDVNRVIVMEHGIDRMAPPSGGQTDWLRRHFGIEGERPIVLFFGSVARYKGLDVLVRAFEQLPTVNAPALVIAGLCRDGHLRQELKLRLAGLVNTRRAFWHDDFVPEEQVLHYFHGADMLVLPYRHIDQSGLVFMALSTGLPVVATDVGSLGEYAPLTGGCVVAPGDAGALATAIGTMLAARPNVDRERVVRSARRFLWAKTVRPVLAAYGSTV